MTVFLVYFMEDTEIFTKFEPHSILAMFKKFRKYLDKRHIINAVGSFDEAGLICAVEEAEADVLQMMIERNISPNATNKMGVPAISLGVKGGNILIMKTLIEGGADIDRQDRKGMTPLMHAMMMGNKHVVSFLLDHDADLEIQDKDGNTALHKAAEAGKTTLVQALIEAGSELDTQNKLGITALMIAVENMRAGIVKALIQAGANPTLTDKDGESALDQHQLSPRLTQMLNEAAKKYKRDTKKQEKQARANDNAEALQDLKKQVGEISNFVFGMIDTTVQNLDRTGLIKELEHRGKEIIEQLNQQGLTDLSLTPDSIAQNALLKENLTWLLELLVELRKIGASVSELAANTQTEDISSLKKFQHQITTAVHNFAVFLEQQKEKTDEE